MRTFEVIWGPFLERPDSLPGPESDFDIKVSRKVWCVLTSDEVHFVSFVLKHEYEAKDVSSIVIQI